MQQLSVLFKCKIYYLCTYLIIILEFSNQFRDFYWSTHSLYFFLILKIYQNHIIMGILFFNCQDHFLSL